MDHRLTALCVNSFRMKFLCRHKVVFQKMGVNGERFAGGMLLSNEERITFMAKESNAWTEAGWDIYRRHK